MELGAGIENETLQNLIRDCLLELNRLKFNLTELEIAKAKDTTPQKIQELENHILNKEKEVSLIKFKAEDEISLLKKQLDEKDALIKNQEDRIYELDYVNNSLDEIKEYFAEQLRDYKKKELAEVNERLNESFKSIAEKEAQINMLSRTIDDYKIQVIKLENNAEFKSKISNLEREIEYKNNELSEKNNIITAKENEVSLLRESTIPKDNYINLQKELSLLRESTIPKEDYINLQRELSSKDDKIKRLEEINNFFNELQEEQEAYETMDRTPPFRLEKKRFNKK
jgi:chromosome segregation ATPase